MHRDVKPDNLLIDDKCNIKFCDFGLSRVVPKEGGEGDVQSTLTKNIKYLESEENLMGKNNTFSESSSIYNSSEKSGS